MQSDPIGLSGLFELRDVLYRRSRDIDVALGRADGESARQLEHTYNFAYFLPSNSSAFWQDSSLYGYGIANPFRFTDPTGQGFGAAIVGATIAGGIIGGLIWITYDCVKHCKSNCPIKAGGDEFQEDRRNRWIADCKSKCGNLFPELFMKLENVGNPTRRGFGKP